MTSLLDALFQTPEQIAERQLILSERFFLVRQGSLGEIFRCGLCNGKHPYLTLRCVEQPFSGIDGGLLAYYKVLGRPGVLQRMTPSERTRFRRVQRLFQPVVDLPEMSDGHPELAQQAVHDNALGDRDALISSVALGVLEPIPRSLAQRFLDRINLRNGHLTVPGLSSEGV